MSDAAGRGGVPHAGMKQPAGIPRHAATPSRSGCRVSCPPLATATAATTAHTAAAQPRSNVRRDTPAVPANAGGDTRPSTWRRHALGEEASA